MKLKSNKNMFALIMDKLGSWSLLILIGVVMAFANSKFLTSSNILNVLRQIAVVTIGAVGVSFVILGGGFDLSTGMIATFAGCNSAALIVNHGWMITPWRGMRRNWRLKNAQPTAQPSACRCIPV